MLDIKFKLNPTHTSERDWMQPSSLKTLFWNCTYACNYKCGVCFSDAHKKRKNELTAQEILKFFSTMQGNGLKDVIVSGGEPFLRPDLLDVLCTFKKWGISARIASNGSLLNQNTIKTLKQNTSTKSFQISLDCLSPEKYKILHGCSAEHLPKVIENIKHIKQHGFHTTIAARLMPLTLPEIPALLDFAVEQNIDTVTVHMPMQTKRHNDTFDFHEDLFQKMTPVFDHYTTLKKKWLIEIYVPWAAFHPVVKTWEKKEKIVYSGCTAARDRLTINPSGEIGFCVCLDTPKLSLGNIRTHDIRDIFKNAPLCSAMKNPAAAGLCTDCEHVAQCGGGCRTNAYLAANNIMGQDTLCPLINQVSCKTK